MSQPNRITDRVTLVGGPQISDGSDCLVYLVDLGDLVLIDNGTGPSWPRIRQNINDAGYDSTAIHSLVLTHCHVDHIGATTDVIRHSGCEVIAHELDREAIETGDSRRTAASWYGIDLPEVTVSRIVSEDETITFSDGALRLIHTPGHTPGSMVALLEEDGQKILFGQDIHGPFSPEFDSDVEAWRRSMQSLIELEADILCEGHYGIYRGTVEVRRFIESQLAAH